MIISHTGKFIFIHIWKTGGNSIKEALLNYDSVSAEPKINNSQILSDMFPKHCTAIDLKRLLPNNIFGEFYKFMFVRNPFDLHVSLFTYLKQNENHRLNNLAESFLSFEEYLNWRVKINFREQCRFGLDESDKWLVDFIGKFENIEQDFQNVCKNLKLNTLHLPHKNKSDHHHYRSYYNAATRSLIEKYHRDDLNYFNYEF